MSAAEIQYTFRVPYADVLERGRTQTVALEAYRDGALVAPVSGTFTLLDPGANVLIDEEAVTVAGSIATYAIQAADLPATLDLAEGYQERWSLVMPDDTTRTVRREAAVARFLLHPPAADIDITSGEYANLLAEFAGVRTSLQGFLDEAWRQILERLFQSDRWPDQMVSQSALREPLRQKAMHLAFKELYRVTEGNQHWERLMTDHGKAYEDAWARMQARWDRDGDGMPDQLERERSGGVVHRHIGPRASLHGSRDPRW